MSTITGIGPSAITGKISASSGTPIGQEMADGSVIYNRRITKTFADIKLDGNSIKPYDVMEARIGEDDYGYVLLLKDLITGAATTLPDGSRLTYLYYGTITIE